MADVVVCGGGTCGLLTATLLAKAGHEVTVLERDPAAPPAISEAWEMWQRRGVN
ncbi:MAG: FAD-dependent oxidoreductase [Acidimicrobiia bacterium]|nr:FAD-dependent oxidoreductase [Acidimicrobiia bacterium]